MAFKITSLRFDAGLAAQSAGHIAFAPKGSRIADLVAARAHLVRLDDEVGPAAMRLLADLATRAGGEPLQTADVERAAEVAGLMKALARGAAELLDGIGPAAEHVSDAELLARQWMEWVGGPDRPHARCAGRRGLIMLGEGQRLVTAALEALARVGAEDPGGRGKRKRGRPQRDPRLLDRLLQLAGDRAPTEEHADTINREFGTGLQVETLKKYYWRHRRQAGKRAA